MLDTALMNLCIHYANERLEQLRALPLVDRTNFFLWYSLRGFLSGLQNYVFFSLEKKANKNQRAWQILARKIEKVRETLGLFTSFKNYDLLSFRGIWFIKAWSTFWKAHKSRNTYKFCKMLWRKTPLVKSWNERRAGASGKPRSWKQNPSWFCSSVLNKERLSYPLQKWPVHEDVHRVVFHDCVLLFHD